MTSESMSSTGANVIPSSSSSGSQDDHAPLWRYVTKLEKMGEGGGNTKFQCNYCEAIFKGSYFRVKSHLLKNSGQGIRICTKVTPQQLEEMQRVVAEAETRLKPIQVPLPPSTQPQAPLFSSLSTGVFRKEGFELKKRKASGNSALEKAFNIEAREQLRSEIARMFYSGGLPFHFARNPHYVNSFTFAANNMISGFVPPGYNVLRTTLLKRERANIERLLQPIKGLWREKGVSIVSDGWTDAQRRPLINFMAASEGGPIFLKVVNCEKEYKDKYFIANLIKEAIGEVGPENVVQMITDNAPVCKAAGMLVELQHPHIFWTPCVVHTLNLALKNICAAKNTERNEIAFEECRWITEISGDAVVIRNFIMNHSLRLALFNEFVPLKLLAVADTRFASVVVMLKRFKLIKRGLQTLVISDRWSLYRDEDVGKAAFVKEIILNDVWWDKVDYILSFTGPIYDMLRLGDTDKPTLPLVYDMWDCMIEKVKAAIYRHEGNEGNEPSVFYEVVHAILVDRWNKSSTPLHCMAHSLNPRYYSKEWIDQDPNRTPPHKDVEISEERNKCLRRYFPNSEERRLVNLEYARFSGSMDTFGSFDSIQDMWALDAKSWWLVYGASAPMLQTLAIKLLGQPCSSSCCERNWSTYSFIHSVRRNKILPRRAEDLVFVHTNLRLLSRSSEQYKQGGTKMWDVGGDSSDPFEGAGVLEVANLSLDEPDMEAMVFDVEENENDDV